MGNIRKANRSYDFLWLSLGIAPLLLIALLLPVTPQDYWWYLRLGQDVLRMGHVPTIETYSFTHAGQPIINQPWLSAVIFWLAYSIGGLNLTFLLRFVCVGLAYGLLWIWIRQLGAGPRLAAVLVAIAGLAGSNNWSFRPQMFAYPLFVLVLLILWNWHRGRTKFIWALPLIALAWANLHDSFLMIFILEGSAILFGSGDRKSLILASALSFLATLITPFHLALWQSLIHSFISPISWNVSAEWLPPTNAGWQMNIFFAWVLLFAPLAAFSTRRLSLLGWVWLLGLLWMSFSGMRYVIWGLFVLAAFSAALLVEWDERWIDHPVTGVRPVYNGILAVLFLLLPLVALPGVRERLGVHSAPFFSPDTPIAATAWLAQHPELPGPLWSDISISSYLIFALPSRPVAIDTRFEMLYPTSEYDHYSRIASAAPDWRQLLDQDGINLVMALVGGEPRLIQVLAASDQWCLQYKDSVAVIYARQRPGLVCP